MSMNSTGINHSPTHYDKWAGYRKPVFAAVVAVALDVGTGGASNAAYFHDRAKMGYALTSDNVLSQRVVIEEATALDNLDKIKSFLKPSMTDLARALGVSRQAV